MVERTCGSRAFLRGVLRLDADIMNPGLAQKLTDSQLCFVQLRLRISHRAIQQSCDLLMLVAFDFVQQEYPSVSRRQIFDRTGQGDSVHGSCETAIPASVLTPYLFRVVAGGLVQ